MSDPKHTPEDDAAAYAIGRYLVDHGYGDTLVVPDHVSDAAKAEGKKAREAFLAKAADLHPPCGRVHPPHEPCPVQRPTPKGTIAKAPRLPWCLTCDKQVDNFTADNRLTLDDAGQPRTNGRTYVAECHGARERREYTEAQLATMRRSPSLDFFDPIGVSVVGVIDHPAIGPIAYTATRLPDATPPHTGEPSFSVSTAWHDPEAQSSAAVGALDVTLTAREPAWDPRGPIEYAPSRTGKTLEAHVHTSHVATLPDGTTVNLPAGTVLREGTCPASFYLRISADDSQVKMARAQGLTDAEIARRLNANRVL